MSSRILQSSRLCHHINFTNKLTSAKAARGSCQRFISYTTSSKSLRSVLQTPISSNKLVASAFQNGICSNFKKTNNQMCFIRSKTTTTAFKVLDGEVDTSTQEFKSNHEHCKELEDRFEQLLSFVKQGGGEKGLKRQQQQNKMFVRDRLRMVLDDYDNEFLEVGALAGMGMQYGDVPSAGTVTGVGRVQGVWCTIMANDASVKGGTMYPITVKKNLRVQEIAMMNRIPSLYLVDSGGAFLPLQDEIFPDKEHGGRAFYNEAIMSSEKIPQVAIVCGSCTAGGAYIPAMADEAVIVHKMGTIFLGGPPLVYAATGEKITSEDLGGATLHCKVSGVTDHFAETEEDAFKIGRGIISCLNISLPQEPETWDEPLYGTDELSGLAPRPGVESGCVKKIVARLVDGSRFQEFKTMYGPQLVTGFAHINGYLVGVVANNGNLMHDAATKGSHFVTICCQRNIPLIFLQNTSNDESLMVATLDEQSGEVMGDTLRARAKMIAAIACANVPKLTVIMGGSFGANNFAMCGRSQDPRLVFSWPGAQIGMLSPEDTTRHIVKAKYPDSVEDLTEEQKTYESKVSEKVHLKSSSFYASSRMWDDGVILPHKTRQVLGQCLSIVSQDQEQVPTKYGVIRM